MNDDQKTLLPLYVSMILISLLAIILIVQGVQEAFGEKLESKCLIYSDGTIAVLYADCLNRADLYKAIEWFLSKGYTLDAVTNDHVMIDEVWMTR